MTHFSGFEGKLVCRCTPSSAPRIHMPLSVGHEQTTDYCSERKSMTFEILLGSIVWLWSGEEMHNIEL